MLIQGTEERDLLWAESADDTVEALSGNDLIFNQANGTTLIGGAGNDQYRLYEAETSIVEAPDGGRDTIWAWDNVTMPGNVEDLLFRRVSDWHAIRGNDLPNRIEAGGGRQAMAGGGGDDTLIGGTGGDSFHFAPGGGHDVVTDFEPGTDRLVLWQPEMLDFDDLMAGATVTEEGTLLTLGADQTVTLRDVQPSELSARDVSLPAPAGPPDGAELTFAAEFDDRASLGDGTWNTRPVNGHPVTSVVARGARHHTFVDSETTGASGEPLGLDPFSVEDGVLSITARRTPEALSDEIAEPWISGSLDTFGGFSQTYGYYEVRARTPEGQGFWPGFWLTRDDHVWPPEIDILEMQGNETHILHNAVHSELWGDKVTAAEDRLVPDTSDAFHRYGMLWTPETVTFTFDGREMFEVETPEIMHDPMVLRLTLAMGGWNGAPDASTPDSGAFEVDYVRAYRLPGLEDLPRADDMSAYADLEAGVLNTSNYGERDLYGDNVLRAAELERVDLSLEPEQAATLVGDAGANLLTGNAEGTTFNGGAGPDGIVAGGGDDYVIGGPGADTIEGGPGRDTLVGGAGDDTYVLRRGDGTAAPGYDLIVERPDAGADTIHFPDIHPSEVRSYLDWARWYVVVEGDSGPEYFAVKVRPGIGGHDLGSYVERAVFADGTVWDLSGGLTLSADDRSRVSSGTVSDDTILGNGGDDTLIGMDGLDVIDGGAGRDDLYGWNGADLLSDSGPDGGDRLFGEAGNDTLLAGEGIDVLRGGDGNDSLRASADGDILHGDAGADLLKGHDGDDTLHGGPGDDHLAGDGGADRLDGGAGQDTLHGAEGADLLLGGDGDDRLRGGAGADTLDGGAGTDRLKGGAGADVFRFDFAGIARDVIQDFAPGDRVEIRHGDDPAGLSLGIEGHKLFIEDTATGEARAIVAPGVTLSDVDLSPG